MEYRRNKKEKKETARGREEGDEQKKKGEHFSLKGESNEKPKTRQQPNF